MNVPKSSQVVGAILVTMATLANVALAQQTQQSSDEQLHEGSVVRISDNEILLAVNEDSETFVVSPRTKILIDGAEAKLTDIRLGSLATIVAQRSDGKLVAKVIDARMKTHHIARADAVAN